MYNLTGKQTKENLLKILSFESSQANRYFYYSQIAKQECLNELANLFSDTSIRKWLYSDQIHSYLNLKKVINNSSISYNYGLTWQNLKSSKKCSNELMYFSIASTALEENLIDIANFFIAIANFEKSDMLNYKNIYKKLEDGNALKKNNVFIWKCKKCNDLHEWTSLLLECPTCLHPNIPNVVTIR